MLIIFIQASFWLWRLFINNPTPRNAEAVARSWFYLSLILAFVCAILVFGFKAFRKFIEPTDTEKIWKRKETWQLIILGLLPVFISLFGAWILVDDYYQIIQFSGLAIGAFISIFPYLIFMGLLHLLFGWRRELF